MDRKELLRHDICSRLPYGLKGQISTEIPTGHYDINSGHLDYTDVWIDVELDGIQEEEIIFSIINEKDLAVLPEDYYYTYDEFIPYLRPMSSMTEEEKVEYEKFFLGYSRSLHDFNVPSYIDWLNEHHFDYRGLIEKGLASKAPEEMYK